MDDPFWSVKLKLSLLTVIVSIVALEPETLSVTPATESTVSVVSVTSSDAARARPGNKSAASVLPISARRFFFMAI